MKWVEVNEAPGLSPHGRCSVNSRFLITVSYCWRCSLVFRLFTLMIFSTFRIVRKIKQAHSGDYYVMACNGVMLLLSHSKLDKNRAGLSL